MSVFINKMSALKQAITNYISNGTLNSNDKYCITAINKYKSSHDKYKSNIPLNDYFNSIIQKIDKKIQVIQQQQQMKQAYLHYVNNDVNSLQFSHNDESTYNITTLDNLLNNFNTAFNYTEDLYLDESNIFFDIDYEEVKVSDSDSIKIVSGSSLQRVERKRIIAQRHLTNQTIIG